MIFSNKRASQMILWIVFGFIAGTVLFIAVQAQGAKVLNGANDVFKGILPCTIDLDGDGLIQNDLCPCGQTYYETNLNQLDNKKSFFKSKSNGVALTNVSVRDVARIEKFLTELKENPPAKGQIRKLYVSAKLDPYLNKKTPQQSDFCFDGGNCSFNQFMLDHFNLSDSGEYKKICDVPSAECQKRLDEACAKDKTSENNKDSKKNKKTQQKP